MTRSIPPLSRLSQVVQTSTRTRTRVSARIDVRSRRDTRDMCYELRDICCCWSTEIGDTYVCATMAGTVENGGIRL